MITPYSIHTEGSGYLAKDCSPQYVTEVARAMAASDHALIHLHGGLNTETAARQLAARLVPYYAKAKLTSVFFVWETGVFETVGNNLGRIGNEPVFMRLVIKLLRHVVGKALLDVPGKGAGDCPLPTPIEVQMECEKTREIHGENVPYEKKQPIAGMSEVKKGEQKRFEDELKSDADFQRAVAGVLKGLKAKVPAGSKSAAIKVFAVPTLMSLDVRKELLASATKPGSKGLLETAVVVKHAVSVFIRVVKRLKDKRDHGIYATIVEELLREFYIDAIGSLVWGSMKNDAEGNFKPVHGKNRPGGTWLFQELAAAIKDRRDAGLSVPKISVVGHSAGTIFASHMMLHVAARYPELTFHRLVFLASACRFDLFAEVLASHKTKPRWKAFRAFALEDKLEAGYWEVPAVYPRSLLYLVSGILERDGKKSAFDMPLVGMQRYFNANIYSRSDILAVTRFLKSAKRQHWALSTASDGCNTDAIRHGGFVDIAGKNITTMKSVVHFLTH
jgi:hypothetical protein